ncbi:hypothetical protein V5O48_007344 [Marasmius crinis-equi]|uniref:DUF6535 domain-containing protein n=1 Tax=Marasmius crinis-equi TaxID=585013 RepID=A0ABR3FGZ2_9AGAR
MSGGSTFFNESVDLNEPNHTHSRDRQNSAFTSTSSRTAADSVVNDHGLPSNGAENGKLASQITDPWTDGGPYFSSPQVKGDPWEAIIKTVDKVDDEMAKGWREDIDTLLVFAGLFSAAVTAFIIESYRWLQPDPEDRIISLLSDISSQLKNPSIDTSTPSAFAPTPSVVRINTVWFLSLVMSLSAVLFGILCKQWLREHRHDTHTATREEAMLLRQLRHESFSKWGVPTFLAFLPILLELALILFFVGILDLLWSLHPVPASLVTGAIAVSVGIYILTTILPTWRAIYILAQDKIIQEPITICPYKSPQSWLFYVFSLGIVQTLFPDKLYPRFPDWARSDLRVIRDFFISSEAVESFPFLHRPYRLEGLKWLVQSFGDNTSLSNYLFQCLQRCEHPRETVAYALDLPTESYATHLPHENPLDSLYHAFFVKHPDPDIQMFVKELKMRYVYHTGELTTADPLDALATRIFSSNGPTTAFYRGVVERIRSGKHLKVEIAFQCDNLIESGLKNGDGMVSDLKNAALLLCMSLWSHPLPRIREESIVALDDFELFFSMNTAYADTSQEVKQCFSVFLNQLFATMFDINERPTCAPVICSDRGREFVSFLNDLIVYKGLVEDRALETRWVEVKRRLASAQTS